VIVVVMGCARDDFNRETQKVRIATK
jgi:hypothetical protein